MSDWRMSSTSKVKCLFPVWLPEGRFDHIVGDGRHHQLQPIIRQFMHDWLTKLRRLKLMFRYPDSLMRCLGNGPLRYLADSSVGWLGNRTLGCLGEGPLECRGPL